MRTALAALLSSLAGAALASDFTLSMPVDCTLGETCYIQQFVDRDPGPGWTDFTCGSLAYDGHKGTDFAVPTIRAMQAGVNVLASAPGVVVGTRDSMSDILYSEETAASVEGRECGNGVRIDHGDGWFTQYCHLKLGSVAVATGDTVERGAVLGQIGLSGRTQFPHVHIGVTKDGQVIDPFGKGDGGTCTLDPAGEDVLWNDDSIRYVPGGILDAGFSDRMPDFSDVIIGRAAADIENDSSAIVFYALSYGLREGDTLQLILRDPRGATMAEDEFVLDRNRARQFRAIGRRNRSLLEPGEYTGTVTILRDFAVYSQDSVTIVVE